MNQSSQKYSYAKINAVLWIFYFIFDTCQFQYIFVHSFAGMGQNEICFLLSSLNYFQNG